ncbi:MAG TPA: hypothetical protein VL992_16195 [Tepidisphaeraceae bacterium]|nr:hypothetical protein [Tepidisphaeraceae bacterium]
MSQGEPIIALMSDLIFFSKIAAEAKAAGQSATMIRTVASLGGQQGKMLLVDLNMTGAIDAAAQWQQATGRPAIGFVSHVDAAAIAAAKAAGLAQVLARSRFVQVLPELVATA